jgi:restriction system protein
MGRNRKQSTFEDLVNIAEMLPWKWGVALAVIAYLGFHYMATLPPITAEGITAKNLGQTMGGVMSRQIAITSGSFLQYIIPFAFLLGSGLSFFKQRKRIRLHANVENAPSQDALGSMSWQEFEALVAEAFSRKGYKVIERGGAGPDGGVDVELRMGNDKYLVQCK